MSKYTRITSAITRIITSVFLALAFILGVGAVAILFRLTGRRLLGICSVKSTWQSPTGSGDPARMY